MKSNVSFNTKDYREYSAVVRVLDDLGNDVVTITRKSTPGGVEMHFVVEVDIKTTEAEAFNMFKDEYTKLAKMYMFEYEGLDLSTTWQTMKFL